MAQNVYQINKQINIKLNIINISASEIVVFKPENNAIKRGFECNLS